MTAPQHAAKCSRCGRPLSSPASVAAGVGPRCAAIEAALASLSDKQRDKARQLITDGGVTRTSRKGVARVPSDENGRAYVTSVNGNCTCEWGLRRTSATVKTCYHVPVVQLEFRPRRVLRRSDFAKAA